MKIYTRTGDDGTTGLFGGDRVSKAHPLIEAYGTVDETNSALGLARTHLVGAPGEAELGPVLRRLQRELFELGSDLATPVGARARVPRTAPAHVEGLEKLIDAFDGQLPALRTFILPGGAAAAAQLHVARTICRRSERLVAKAKADVTPSALLYLNRLSDLLFVLARWVNHESGLPDEPWKPRRD